MAWVRSIYYFSVPNNVRICCFSRKLLTVLTIMNLRGTTEQRTKDKSHASKMSFLQRFDCRNNWRQGTRRGLLGALMYTTIQFNTVGHATVTHVHIWLCEAIRLLNTFFIWKWYRLTLLLWHVALTIDDIVDVKNTLPKSFYRSTVQQRLPLHRFPISGGMPFYCSVASVHVHNSATRNACEKEITVGNFGAKSDGSLHTVDAICLSQALEHAKMRFVP